MKAIDIYSLKPKKVTKELDELKGFYADLLPEIDSDDLRSIDDKNEKVEIQYYVDYSFDGRRTWTLASVWFDSYPVMIIQRAGREGDDHYKRFITSKDNFTSMVQYIRSLITLVKDDYLDVIDENEDRKDLEMFYGHYLDEFYNTEFKPQYKPGDILTIPIPKENVMYDFMVKEWIETEIEICDVTDNPYDTYRVKETKRMIRWGDLKDNEERIMLIKDMTEKQKTRYSEKYWRLNSKLEIVN